MLTCDATPGRSPLRIALKRKIYTENPHFHMNECQQECMAHSKRFPLKGRGGSETLYTQQSVFCMEEKTSWCVFCTYQKRSLYEAKGIQEIKDKPMGKWIKCFVSEEKKIQSFRRLRHEYNLVYCQASRGTGSHQHLQEISFFLHQFAFLSAPQTNPYRSSPSTSPSLPLSLSLSLFLFIFSHRRAPLYYVLWPSVTFRSGV